MRRPGLQVDERSVSIFKNVCTRMYLATIAGLWLDVLYRQVWLHQPVTQFMDIALVLTANVVLAIAAVLYFGGVSIPRFRASLVALFYAVCVIAGSAFWLAKDPPDSAGTLAGKVLIVASISGILIVLYLLAAYLGMKKTEKDLEE